MTDKQVAEEVGPIFKEYRVGAGYSQGEVSRFLHYSSPQFVSNFERGLCMLPLPKLKKALKLFKVDGHHLVQVILDLQRAHLEKNLLSSPSKKKRKGAS